MEHKKSRVSETVRVFVLNNTIKHHHYGCYRTMNNIFSALSDRGGKYIGSLYVGSVHVITDGLRDLLQSCDFILINGEGTLHDANVRPILLAQTGALMKIMYKKPVYLINAAYMRNSRYMADCLRHYDMVFARDEISLEELRSSGISAERMPDMTFYNVYDSSDVRRENYIGLIGSVIPDVRDRLFDLQKNSNEIFKALPILYENETFLSYINSIKKSKGIVTGRFHGVCFAVQTRTPFLAIESNIPKITSLLEELNMTDRLIKPADIDSQLKVPDFSESELKVLEDYTKKAPQIIDSVFDKIFDHYAENYLH